MKYRFNVFGKPMVVVRKDEAWELYLESDVGMRTRVYDVAIPAELSSDELGRYLDDIYHEMATQRHPTVEQLAHD